MTRDRRLLPIAFASIVWLLASVAQPLAATSFKLPIYPLEQPAPEILERIPEDDDLSSITLTADGALAATAVVVTEKPYKAKSTVRFYSPGAAEPVSREFQGEIRDLLFAPEGDALFALLHIAAKKRPGDVFLVRIDVASWKSRRELRLPPSAQGLAYWPTGDALLIVCADEIRSVLRPGYRSGPLYRLLGVNTSAATLDGSRLLVGRADGVVLIDLQDPQGEEQMPIRGRVDSFEPVRQVAVNRDGSLALARLEAGGIVPIDVSTPAFGDEIGRGLLPGRPWPRRAPEPRVPAPAPDPTPTPAVVAPLILDEEPPVPAVQDEVEPLEAVTPPEPIVAVAPPAKIPTAAQIAGTIAGEGRADVDAVVFFGPDNILHEARRVQPDEHGRWHVEGLEPGRYRLQLSAGGDRVLTVDPVFRVVQLAPGQPTVDAAFRVLEAP